MVTNLEADNLNNILITVWPQQIIDSVPVGCKYIGYIEMAIAYSGMMPGVSQHPQGEVDYSLYNHQKDRGDTNYKYGKKADDPVGFIMVF